MKNFLSLVKFSHTIFAMPFALLGFFLAINRDGQEYRWTTLVLVVLCMVFARNAAMAFNRYLDRHIDKANPRTASREIPTGIIGAGATLWFVIANSLAFILTTWFINPLCFALSPLALAIILGYSYTKRVTVLCHLVLGLGLALAPVGAYIAVTGVFALLPVLYGGAVMCWVAGFDIIYALQDEEFDRANDLSSIPAALGKSRALQISVLLHCLSAVLIFTASWLAHRQYPPLHILNFTAAVLFVASLIYQHSIVKADDLSRVNVAFFTTNGLASLLFGLLVVTDFYL